MRCSSFHKGNKHGNQKKDELFERVMCKGSRTIYLVRTRNKLEDEADGRGHSLRTEGSIPLDPTKVFIYRSVHEQRQITDNLRTERLFHYHRLLTHSESKSIIYEKCFS